MRSWGHEDAADSRPLWVGFWATRHCTADRAVGGAPPGVRHLVDVTIDTDAHAPGQLEWLRNGVERAAKAHVPVERIVTAWPVEDLLAWTADHYHRPAEASIRR